MEYSRLGATGVKVSELCLGTTTFGREADVEDSSSRTVRRPSEGRVPERSSAATGSQRLDIPQRGATVRRCAVSRDGRRVRVRAASPEDLEPLRRMFARISPESMYRRFLSPYPAVPGWALEHAVHVDHDARESLVAVSGGKIVGQAMYVRSENEAEVAVVVEDAWQRRGIGTLLLSELAAVAASRGIEAFTGTVSPENSQMLGLASAARARRRYSAEDGAYQIRVPLGFDRTATNLATARAAHTSDPSGRSSGGRTKPAEKNARSVATN